MAIINLYHTCFQQIKQLRPQERKTRARTMSWLMVGLFLGRCVHLSHIARKIPGRSQNQSKTKKIARLLDNKHIQVRAWYEPIARGLLQAARASGHPIRLLVDGSKVGNGHQLLMVALAYRRRAIPLVWSWVKGKRGHSSARHQCALLAYVHSLIPPETTVLVAGDSEFGAVPVLRLLDEWQWGYALRQKSSHLLCRAGTTAWVACASLLSQPGQTGWLEGVLLTEKHLYQTNFLAYWRQGEEEPWLLATNMTTARQTKQLYLRRMWIEEMFGDFKKHGFDLECTRLQRFAHLSRLTLAVSLLYYWLVVFGSQVIKNGKRYLVDRSDRRDLSIFRIGFDFVDRCWLNDEPISIRAVPYFYKLSGS